VDTDGLLADLEIPASESQGGDGVSPVSERLSPPSVSNSSTSVGTERQGTRNYLERHLRGKWILCKAINKEIEMRQRGIDESISWSANPKKLKALASIEQIISSWHSPDYQPNFKKDSKPQVLEYIHLKNTVLIEGEPVLFDVIVECDSDGLLHYDIMIPKEKVTATLDSAGVAVTLRQTAPDTKSGICRELSIDQHPEKNNESIVWAG